MWEEKTSAHETVKELNELNERVDSRALALMAQAEMLVTGSSRRRLLGERLELGWWRRKEQGRGSRMGTPNSLHGGCHRHGSDGEGRKHW